MGAGFPEPDAKRMVGTWVLTDNDNVPFNLILRHDGSSLTVTGKRHPDVGTPQRMTRNQLLETGNWQAWGNGIRSTYADGWTDTIQIGPAGEVQWSWKPGSSLNAGPSNHGKACAAEKPGNGLGGRLQARAHAAKQAGLSSGAHLLRDGL